MSIKIITDSASDILPSEGERLGVTVVPMMLTIDGKEYLDGVDLTVHEFYSMLASSKELPNTAQPQPRILRRPLKAAVTATILSSSPYPRPFRAPCRPPR